jgi:GntR family transcriptional regulator
MTVAAITRRAPERLSRAVTWGVGRAIQDADIEPRPRAVDVVVQEIRADGAVGRALSIPEGTWVLSRSRRFLVDDRPVQLATSYLPLDLVRGTAVTYTDAGPGGTYARLADLGHGPVRFTERIRARVPHPQERQRLEREAGSGLVFEVERLAFDEPGRVVEMSRMILDAAAYALEYDFPA